MAGTAPWGPFLRDTTPRPLLTRASLPFASRVGGGPARLASTRGGMSPRPSLASKPPRAARHPDTRGGVLGPRTGGPRGVGCRAGGRIGGGPGEARAQGRSCGASLHLETLTHMGATLFLLGQRPGQTAKSAPLSNSPRAASELGTGSARPWPAAPPRGSDAGRGALRGQRPP